MSALARNGPGLLRRQAMSEPVRILPCPTCRKPVKWSATNNYRPFCSERCRLIDFGGWADERYRIEGDPAFDDVPSDSED